MSRSSPTLFGLALFAIVIACGRKTPQPASSGAGTTTASNVAASNGAVSTGLTLTTSDVAEARVVPLTDAVSISGPLEPAQTVALRTQINAIVSAVRADRGTRVRRGQVLIEL